jgi:hypothetical protein
MALLSCVRTWFARQAAVPVVRRRARLRLESLETRTLPSPLSVTNPSDPGVAGVGSLQGEIAAAQSGDTIGLAGAWRRLPWRVRARRSRPGGDRPWQWNMRRFQLALFLLLSLADFVLTQILLEQQKPGIYEGNPVARQCLAGYGWPGLLAYKAAMVLTAATALGLIARQRPRLAGSILTFACAALTATVLYSGALAVWRPVPVDEFTGINFGAEADHQQYVRIRNGLRQELISRRRTLRDAARALGETAWAQQPGFIHGRRTVFPGRGEEECFGAILVASAVAALPVAEPRTASLAEQLLGEFEATYGTAAHWSRSELLRQAFPGFVLVRN